MSLHRIEQGLVGEATLEVTPSQSAAHLGSGTVGVLATPAMVAFIERTCQQLVQPMLSSGNSTVGTGIQIRHLAPTPIGAEVRARVEVTSVEGREIVFRAQIWDDFELVGEAEHHRVVIDVDRFMKRVEAKRAEAGAPTATG